MRHASLSKLENVIDFLFVKFRLPVSRALWSAAFLFGVCHVFGLRTKEKMFWIYAGTIITTMANIKTRNYGSVMEFITKAMGLHSIFREFSTDQDAITVRVFGSSPNPASIGFLDVVPKIIFDGEQALMFVIASFTAIFCAALTQPKAFSRKLTIALWTDTANAAPTINDYGWFIVQAVYVLCHTLFAPIKKPLAGGIGAVVSSKRTPRQRAKTAYNICARIPNYALAR